MIDGNMLRVVKTVVVLMAGVALGLTTTWATVIGGAIGGSVTDGPWQTTLYAGSSEGGPYSRARIAIHGLLALSREETIYYFAATDGDGDALEGTCSYVIEGRDPPTRWWSITAYGADDFLIATPSNRFSVSMNSVIRRADGSFVIALATAPVASNWIAVSTSQFNLTLRLYNPRAEVVANPADVALPAIRKAACK